MMTGTRHSPKKLSKTLRLGTQTLKQNLAV